MAIKRLTIDGYGQVELNNVAFRRDGRIEAQCKPNATDFSAAPVENGMLLSVDMVKREVSLPVDNSLPIALVYSAEHIYDERTPGLKNFKLNGTDDFLPRLGYLAVGDKWTTNCIAYNDAEYATESALKSALVKATAVSVPVYGAVDSCGAIVVTSSKPSEGIVLRAMEATMPDGTYGVKFQVYSC